MTEGEDATRDPGEYARPATAQDPANRATFPGGRDSAHGRARDAGLIAVLVSDAVAPVSGASVPADGAKQDPGHIPGRQDRGPFPYCLRLPVEHHADAASQSPKS